MESEAVHLLILPPFNVLNSHTTIKTQDNTELETQKLRNTTFTQGRAQAYYYTRVWLHATVRQ